MADRDLVDDAVNRIRIYFGALDLADESFLGLTIFDVLKEKNKEISDLREVIDTTREICGMAKIDWNKKPSNPAKRSPMRMSDYTSVQIPKVLTDKVKQKMAKQGYRTVSEFVIDAVRRRLDEITDQNL